MTMAGGLQSGPQPWWTQPGQNGGGGAALAGLQNDAPAGYEYDPVQMGYTRTPTAAGTRVAQFTGAALGGIPSLAGLGGSGGAGGAGAVGGVGGVGGVGAGAGGPVSAGGGANTSGSGAIAPIQMPDTGPAKGAALASAKDTAGKLARTSIDSLNGELGAAGMMGGGAQAQGTRDIVNDAASQVGDVNRQNLTNEQTLGTDLAKTNYAGGITQRGQDITKQLGTESLNVEAQKANAQLALESRQQMYQLLDLALKGIGGSGAQAY